MSDSETQALRAKEKTEAVPSAEYTKPGPTFTPAVDIFETDTAITLLADMPGVKPNDISIDRRKSRIVPIRSVSIRNPTADSRSLPPQGAVLPYFLVYPAAKNRKTILP